MTDTDHIAEIAKTTTCSHAEVEEAWTTLRSLPEAERIRATRKSCEISIESGDSGRPAAYARIILNPDVWGDAC